MNALLAAQAGAPQPQQSYGSDDDTGTPVDVLVQWFEDAEEATEEARGKSEQARDYYDGKQLTAKELETLRKRGQPDIVINRIQPKINYLIGYEASNRTDPKAVPRTPNDEEAAGAATDALRFVKDKTDLDQAFSGIWENMLIEGFGGLELVVTPNDDGTDAEIEVVKWDWDRLFYDPHSRKADFSDARYLGGVVWMDRTEAERKWADKSDIFAKTFDTGSDSKTYDDRPAYMQWTQRGARQRVRICQMYHKEDGQWMFCVFTKGGKLDSYPVPFQDQDGRSWCPLLLQSAFVDRMNRRYGLVHCMIGVQDEINKRRSKALHRLTMRQVKAEKGAVDDVEMSKREIAKPDGWIETNPGFEFEVLDASQQIAGEINLLQHAQNEIELMGPNAALQGKDDSAPSGRAIAMNQNSGQTEIGVIADRLLWIKKRTYQRVWDLCRQYKKAEWWVRVTDNEDNVKFVGFNRPVTMGEELQKKAITSGMPPEMAQARLAEIQADPLVAKQLQQPVRTENIPSEMYMDITIEQMPSVANVQQEQFDMLVKFAATMPIPPKLLIKASSFRNKKELLQELEGPPPDPVAAEAQKIQLEQAIKKTEAEIEKIRAEAAKTATEADMLANPMGQVQMPQILPPGQAPQAPVAPQDTGQQPGMSESVPAAEEPTGVPDQNVPPTM